MGVFIGGGVLLVMAFGSIAILVIKLRRVTQTETDLEASSSVLNNNGKSLFNN